MKISSDVLENVFTSQFEGGEYESYWFYTLRSLAFYNSLFKT